MAAVSSIHAQCGGVIAQGGLSQRIQERERLMMAAMGVPSKTRALQRLILQHWRDEKAIVFCEFREEMAPLQAHLSAVGISSVLYDGSLSLSRRDEIVRHMSWTWQEVNSLLTSGVFFPGVFHVPAEVADRVTRYISYDVILVQINSGNAGLNLQMCSRVYYTNPNWNPCTEIQAWGRAHRMGQEKKVHVVKLVLSGAQGSSGQGPLGDHKTLDQRVLEVQQNKRNVMSDILGDPDILFNGTVRSVRSADLLFLIG
jgi:superfamily II DNA/RNA helicase